MKLLFLRHAIAEDGRPGMKDWDRELTDEGREQATMVASALRALGVKPGIVLSSPLVRTRQTAEIVAPLLGSGVDFVDVLQPGNSSLKDLEQVLHSYDADSVMLVGHEPDLSSLAAGLVNADERGMLLKKAGLIRVDIDGRPRAGRGRLAWLLTPRVMSYMVER